jgi:hypothetical protein
MIRARGTDHRRESPLAFGLTLFLFVLACCALRAYAEPQNRPDKSPRHAVPDAAAAKASLLRIDQIYQNEIAAAKSPKAKAALATQMLETAAKTENDDAGRFALYTAARNLAVGAGNVSIAFRTIEDEGLWFEIDAVKIKVDALATVLKAAAGSAAPVVSTSDLDALIDAAIALDRYEIARQAAELASTSAAKSHDAALSRWATVRKREVEGVMTARKGALAAEAVLKTDPEDAGAILVLGRFLCLYKNDWEAGLPLLARSKDPVLQPLARNDLAGAESASGKVQLGDRWSAVGQAETAIPRRHADVRAAKWYREALPGLEGLSKLATEKKLAAFSPTDPGTDHGWLVLFRSADPSLWGTDTNEGPARFSRELSHCPKDVHFLKLSAGGARTVIIPIAFEILAKENPGNTGYSWNGSSKMEYGGRHLGICDDRINMAHKTPGFISLSNPDADHISKGWGFGHKCGVNDKQYSSWNGEVIGETVFEISVKTEPLTPEEAKLLLK